MQSFVVLLAPGSAGHIANIVKGYAIAIGVAFAIWFALQWWQKHQAESARERSRRAKAIWRSYLATALQNPELSDPAPGALMATPEAARYRTCVGFLLATADEILSIEPTDAWRETLTRSLAPHSAYLKSSAFRDAGLRDCSEEVRALVERASRG